MNSKSVGHLARVRPLDQIWFCLQLSAFRIRKALPENDSAAHSSSMSNNYRPLQPIGVRQIVSVSIAKMESNDPKEAGAAFTGSVVLVVVLVMYQLFV